MKRDFGIFSVIFIRAEGLLILLLLCFGQGLFASGRKAVQEEIVPVNTEYVFCITAPDVSALSLSRQITGDTVVRSLAGSLSNLSFRFRGEEEAAYYRDYAWARSRSEAAGVLAAKRNERDLLIYRGDPSWRYRKNLKSIDEAILGLEADLEKLEALAPVAEAKPSFTLTAENRNGTYPAPPVPGGEYRFCTDRNADAFLAMAISEYHGRMYLDIRMYTLHTRSYSFEDSVLFSSEDLNEAMDEISVRLAAAVSETFQSAIVVHAEPPDAMILINGALAGLGEMEKQIRLPGNVDISIVADNHVPVSFPLELNSGELAELFIELTPLGVSAFEAVVPNNPGSRVYLGSLYLGETPFTLEIPRNEFSYISVETSSGEIGSVVYRDNNLVKGSAQFTGQPGGAREAVFNTKIPVSPEEKRVDRARRGFYGAYGAFWIILPLASLAANYAKNYLYTNEYKPLWLTVRIGANVAWGSALGVTLFQVFRYLYVSRADATPIVKVPRKETSP